MHRTESLDYGIVVMGEVECILDSGEKKRMGVGDVCVQRGTMHAWRNCSESGWARMVFVLLGVEGGVECEGEGGERRVLGEDLEGAGEGIRGVLRGGQEKGG